MIWRLYLINKKGNKKYTVYYTMDPDRGWECVKKGLTKEQRLEILNQLLREDGIDMTVSRAKYCYSCGTRMRELE